MAFDLRLVIDRPKLRRIERRIGRRNLRLWMIYLVSFAAASYVLLLVSVVAVVLIIAGRRGALGLCEVGLAVAMVPIPIAAVTYVSAWRGITRMYGLPLRAGWLELPVSQPDRFDDWVYRHGGSLDD